MSKDLILVVQAILVIGLLIAFFCSSYHKMKFERWMRMIDHLLKPQNVKLFFNILENDSNWMECIVEDVNMSPNSCRAASSNNTLSMVN